MKWYDCKNTIAGERGELENYRNYFTDICTYALRLYASANSV